MQETGYQAIYSTPIRVTVADATTCITALLVPVSLGKWEEKPLKKTSESSGLGVVTCVR